MMNLDGLTPVYAVLLLFNAKSPTENKWSRKKGLQSPQWEMSWGAKEQNVKHCHPGLRAQLCLVSEG